MKRLDASLTMSILWHFSPSLGLQSSLIMRMVASFIISIICLSFSLYKAALKAFLFCYHMRSLRAKTMLSPAVLLNISPVVGCLSKYLFFVRNISSAGSGRLTIRHMLVEKAVPTMSGTRSLFLKKLSWQKSTIGWFLAVVAYLARSP